MAHWRWLPADIEILRRLWERITSFRLTLTMTLPFLIVGFRHWPRGVIFGHLATEAASPMASPISEQMESTTKSFSTDVVGVDAQSVFVLLFGSYFGNWDVPDDVMRSVLATPTMGLTCAMSATALVCASHGPG